MANTYTQIYIHVVFAVQGRQNLKTLEKFAVEYDEKYLFKWIDDEENQSSAKS